MQWDTNGGGQVTFSVTRNGLTYDVHVTSFQFKDRDDRFAIPAESGAVLEAISALMQDQSRIRLHTTNEPRGSWTTLGFSDGPSSSTYKDVITEGDIGLIYDYVVAQVQEAADG